MRRTCWALLGAAALLGWGNRGVQAGEEDTTAFSLGRAEVLAADVETNEARAALFVSIGTHWVEAGEMERARDLLASAAAFGRKCKGCYAKAQRLADLAVLRYRAGDVMGAGRTFSDARAACDELEDDADRVRALAYLASGRARTGEAMLAQVLYGEAQHLALSLPPEAQAGSLAELVSIQAGAGDLPRMARTLAQLKVISRDEETLATAWFEAAAAGVAAGRFEAAREAVEHINVAPLRLSGLLMLARAQREAGKVLVSSDSFHEAVSLADASLMSAEKADAYLELARAAGVLGIERAATVMRRKAKRACLELGDPLRIIDGLIAWSALAREAGNVVGARAALEMLVHSIGGTWHKKFGGVESRSRVAAALVRSGSSLCAERLLVDIEDPVRRVRARLDLADAYRDAGNTAQALVICGHQLRAMSRWPDDLASDRAESMRRIAVLQAACGQRVAAAKTVARIDKPWHAATACTYIARDL